MTKYKPCPFCGNTGEQNFEFYRWNDPDDWLYGEYAVRCAVCGTTGPGHPANEEKALIEWNRRNER